MKESNKLVYYASRSLLASCFLYVCYLTYQIAFVTPKKLKENFENFSIVNGQFDKIQRSGIGRTIHSTYTYSINGKIYIKKFDRSIPCRDSDLDNEEMRKEIINFSFPVAVSDLDPNLVISLIRERDFEELNRYLKSRSNIDNFSCM